MISDKKSVQLLHKFCLDLGILDWIISPGSRNAPITLTIGNDKAFNAVPVVDERSAAFIALGKALTLDRPVAVTCTSGSASLNYAPAISEAYYQEIPLFVITADRPQKWINNGEGQSIDQVDVYRNYTLASYHLNENDDESLMIEVFNRVADSLFGEKKGPVHLNLAFEEPLYNTVDLDLGKVQFTLPEQLEMNWDKEDLIQKYSSKKRIMILVGQMQKNENLEYILSEILTDKRVVVLTETNSNLYNFNFVNCIDRTLPPVSEVDYHPELVITFGGAIVSKRIKKYLRSIKGLDHWHISASETFPNTFEALSETIEYFPEKVFREFSNVSEVGQDSDFQTKWLQRSFINQERHQQYIEGLTWSDMQAHAIIYDWLPDGAVLHQGNSSVVRYYQLFDPIKTVTYRSNRGVSGIDGCVSTAVGAAWGDDKLNVLVVGDLSFVYDINAWWNKLDKSNLLVLIINNGGGGIFKIIEGPSTTGVLDEYFEVRSKSKIEELVSAHGVRYSKVEDADSLDLNLQRLVTDFVNGQFEGEVIEVDTQEIDSEKVLKEYFQKVNPQ